MDGGFLCVLVDSPWIKLRAERCVTQRGAVLDPFYLLDYPEWVHVAAFDEEDRLLLVRQYRHGAGKMSLELPGGVMDPQESDPLVAGARELLEETGHVAATLTHLARLSPNPSSHTNGVHILLATGARPQTALKLDATGTSLSSQRPGARRWKWRFRARSSTPSMWGCCLLRSHGRRAWGLEQRAPDVPGRSWL